MSSVLILHQAMLAAVLRRACYCRTASKMRALSSCRPSPPTSDPETLTHDLLASNMRN